MLVSYQRRISLILILLSLGFIFLIYRFYSIQILNHTKYVKLQQSQFYYKQRIQPHAGMILDRNGKILALSREVSSLYGIPETLGNHPETVSMVSQILHISIRKINNRIKWGKTNNKSFIWIKRHLSNEEAVALTTYNLKGIGFRKEYKRFYPNSSSACHILGFRGIDEKALAGVELTYDTHLMGESGYRLVPRDARQQRLASLELIQKPPQPGKNVYLTIDSVIQFIVEEELTQAYQHWHSDSATAVVIVPSTGEILALANQPAFNPNKYNEYPADIVRNRAASDATEPGSVFKSFIACALLDKGLAQTSETISCENGKFQVGRRIIHDHKPLGLLSFVDVVVRSSNIGMAKLGLRLGKENMYGYLKDFDFGNKTKCGLPGEASSIITPYQQWNNYTITSVPIGHEIAVTAIQLVKSFSVFANHGQLLQPRILHKITDAQNVVTVKPETVPIRQVIKPETAEAMKGILRAVVERGTGKRANLKEYSVAGKTGTAQKIDPDGRYSHERFISLFVGFAPVEKPQVLVLVMLDEPQGAYYGGTVAAPVVANIIKKTLKYLRVPTRVNMAYERIPYETE